MADAGYDVWLGNNRGNGLSMNNTRYNSSQPEFWDFSWDEMAAIDLPSHLSYVRGVTGAKQVSYIGHSEGTIQAFAGFLTPETAAMANIFIALAPVAYVGNVEVKLFQAMAKLDTDLIFELLGIHEFYIPHAVDTILPGFCDFEPKICSFALQILGGPFPHMNSSRADYYLNYEPNPTSVKNMAHWAQGVRTGTFEKFDYGAKGNQAHYGQPTPPQYDLSKFPTSLPTALFCGSVDYLADPTDVQILLQKLPVSPIYVHYETSTFSHAPVF
jgi:lysosomal acid lipase/cholesteryl ester hydrolase